jgi:hypothetical protein
MEVRKIPDEIITLEKCIYTVFLTIGFNDKKMFFVWRLASGVWRLASGVWRLASGVWRLSIPL